MKYNFVSVGAQWHTCVPNLQSNVKFTRVIKGETNTLVLNSMLDKHFPQITLNFGLKFKYLKT